MTIAQSDHSSIFFELACSSNTDKIVDCSRVFRFTKCNISDAASMLSNIDWSVALSNCINVDDFWVVFKQKC